jgi:hypothetical protein
MDGGLVNRYYFLGFIISLTVKSNRSVDYFSVLAVAATKKPENA